MRGSPMFDWVVIFGRRMASKGVSVAEAVGCDAAPILVRATTLVER